MVALICLLYIYIYIYINIDRYISMDSSHSRRPCTNSGTGMLLIKHYLGYLDPVFKQINLVSFFFSFVWISSKLFTSFEH